MFRKKPCGAKIAFQGQVAVVLLFPFAGSIGFFGGLNTYILNSTKLLSSTVIYGHQGLKRPTGLSGR